MTKAKERKEGKPDPTYRFNIAFGVANFISKHVDAGVARFRLHLALAPEGGSPLRVGRHVHALSAGKGRGVLGAAPTVPLGRTFADVVAGAIPANAASFAPNSFALVGSVDLARITWTED